MRTRLAVLVKADVALRPYRAAAAVNAVPAHGVARADGLHQSDAAGRHRPRQNGGKHT